MSLLKWSITCAALILSAYLTACEREASICSEALRVWPNCLEKTFGLKCSFCNFLLFFFLSYSHGRCLTVLFMSVNQTELYSVWQPLLKGQNEKQTYDIDSVFFRDAHFCSCNTTHALTTARSPRVNARCRCCHFFNKCLSVLYP